MYNCSCKSDIRTSICINYYKICLFHHINCLKGERPYECSVCPRAFNQRVVLREHIRSHHSSPDTKRGSADMPYYCLVCQDLFATSAELIQHLINHSDSNTALKRQPVVSFNIFVNLNFILYFF